MTVIMIKIIIKLVIAVRELCSQLTCLAQIGLQISPDVSRTFCLAFTPFISTADHYQAVSNTSLRSLCEFFGLLSPFWSVIS